MKRILRKIFRYPAVLIVTLYARYIYSQGVDAAERRHAVEGCTVYLAANSFRPDHLVTYIKPQFKTEKRIYGVAARLLTMNTLKRGCYYYTADKFGKGRISDKEIAIRRKAFVKERLKKAKLI